MLCSPEEKELYRIKKGDLLIVEGGAGAGGAAIVEDEGEYYIQNSLHLLRPKHPKAWTPFLKYWIYSLVSRGYIDHACNKATIPHFTKDKVFNMPMPLPPLPEQRRIVEHLDGVCSELDAAEAAIRKQISLLQELRTRLVSDAVTGAVEV
jgi:type I restriction enzyme S subunit